MPQLTPQPTPTATAEKSPAQLAKEKRIEELKNEPILDYYYRSLSGVEIAIVLSVVVAGAIIFALLVGYVFGKIMPRRR